ncbi:MAG: hypothetical protein CVU89_17305 [Firmicutes bacterium HGW-Firmicutes-14]|nr:MAG: hypothetical protein CVU89_17305 [Firmicutes bacterium HGW-Firmicutes-14]
MDNEKLAHSEERADTESDKQVFNCNPLMVSAWPSHLVNLDKVAAGIIKYSKSCTAVSGIIKWMNFGKQKRMFLYHKYLPV